jgi:hypothetical protein
VAAVRRPQGLRGEGLDRAAGQLAAAVAEHVLQPGAGRRDGAVAVGRRDAVLKGVEASCR